MRHSSGSQIAVWLEELFDRGPLRKGRQERDYGIVIDSQRKLARGKKAGGKKKDTTAKQWNKYRFSVCRHADRFFSRTGLLSYQTLPATNHLFKRTKTNALCCHAVMKIASFQRAKMFSFGSNCSVDLILQGAPASHGGPASSVFSGQYPLKPTALLWQKVGVGIFISFSTHQLDNKCDFPGIFVLLLGSVLKEKRC